MKDDIQKLLDNYYTLDSSGRPVGELAINHLSCEQLAVAIDLEIAGDRQSKTIATQLHRKLCSLRRDYEREQVLAFNDQWRAL